MSTPRVGSTSQTTIISQLLSRVKEGDRGAEVRLFELLYADLKKMAAASLRRERVNHTLQPTALVHEVYVRLFGDLPRSIHCRAHFLSLASQVMRRLLVDHARSKRARKRGSVAAHVTLDGVAVYDARSPYQMVLIDEMLHRLAKWDQRQSRVI